MSKSWFSVYAEEGCIVLDVFPFQPGGSTLKLTPEVALWLAGRLKEAAEKAPSQA